MTSKPPARNTATGLARSFPMTATSLTLVTRLPRRWKNPAKRSSDEVQRCEQLGLTLLNFHPGSHLMQIDEDACLARIAESINMTLDKTRGRDGGD